MSFISNGQSDGTSPPRLSATFIPGAQDNYYMPLLSPIPQRSMPEVPEQMQQNLAKLERDTRYMSPALSTTGVDYGNGSNYEHQTIEPNHQSNYPPQTGLGQPSSRHLTGASPGLSPNPGSQSISSIPSQTSLSSEPFFPHIKNPPPNIPTRAEVTEQILEGARQAVLSSNDAEMQVTWAQDALSYVGTAIENNARMADTGMGRSRTPSIERQLRIDALSIISYLADQHHPRAEFIRGTWLEFGKFGHEIDKPQAFRCFSTAARNGYARSEYRIGMQFEETNEVDKALKHYNVGIQANDAASYYRMGMMYLLGQKGQHQDIKRGIDYIRYSADNADENAPQGAYVYAMLLAQELPRVVVPDQLLPNNPTQAKYYLEKSAYLGFSKAQTRMGSAYELQQLNCDFDPIYSLHYNQLAARQGEAEAELAISKWFLSGYDGMFPKNEALAYEYAFRAAKSGLATAEFAIGYFHEIGIYVPSNIAEAKVWYTKAAAHGNEDAEGRITGISRSKTLSRKYHDNMALAKIKSVRGRPNSTQQQSLQMPQIDTYRYPSPTPIGQASQPPTNDHYRTDQYHGPAQALHPYTNPDRPNSRPSPSLYNSQYSNAAAHMQSLRPISTAYAQTPLTAPSSTIPHSNRQSSLPQGYRMSSHGAPVGHSTAVGMDRQNPNGLSAPGSSPITGSTAPTPVRNSYPVDIGYSAPADFSSADRRRMASRPATNLSQQGPKISNTIENPKPALGKQAYSTSHASGPGVHLSKPAPNSKASIVAPTPPLKASITPSAGKKPGNGPSTFAEMGIPQGKQQSDCIVM